MTRVLFTCIGGTNHGYQTKYRGHEIVLPEKMKFSPRLYLDCGEICSDPIPNEHYTYRQFGITADVNYGFYGLKGMPDEDVMERAGIVRVPK